MITVTGAMEAKFCLPVLVVSVLLLFTGLAHAVKDPELMQCKHQCRHLRQYSDEEKQKCIERCEDYYVEKKRGEGQRLRDCKAVLGAENDEASLQRLSQCQEKCEGWLRAQQRQLCRYRCQQRWSREQEREGDGHKRDEEKEDEEEFDKDEDNPYVFEDERFTAVVKTEHGRVDVLEKFTKKSKLLRGIKNYRIGLLVANPHTFVVPSHWDADGVFFVARGRGTISLVGDGKTDSFIVECGDIIRVPAGTPVYMINRDHKEKLSIVKLGQSIFLVDTRAGVLRASGEDPESFYTAFSDEILEAALKTARENLEALFGQQDQGSIVKARREQIHTVSSHAKEGDGLWQSRDGPFNLLKHSTHSNNYGQLIEAGPDPYRPLRDLNVMVSFINITKGSMSAPFYNSRATKIATVVSRKGYYEMICPQDELSSQKSGPSFRRVSAPLRRNTVFIVPPGHPLVMVASIDDDLHVVCFKVNAQGNIRYPLAGKSNIVKRMEREAKELAFKSNAEEVQKIFSNQEEEYFFPGPRKQRERSRDYH